MSPTLDPSVVADAVERLNEIAAMMERHQVSVCGDNAGENPGLVHGVTAIEDAASIRTLLDALSLSARREEEMRAVLQYGLDVTGLSDEMLRYSGLNVLADQLVEFTNRAERALRTPEDKTDD